MERALQSLKAPISLVEQAERDDRLPPGSGIIMATLAALGIYCGIIAVVA